MLGKAASPGTTRQHTDSTESQGKLRIVVEVVVVEEEEVVVEGLQFLSVHSRMLQT
jgi:hypothetical protein